MLFAVTEFTLKKKGSPLPVGILLTIVSAILWSIYFWQNDKIEDALRPDNQFKGIITDKRYKSGSKGHSWYLAYTFPYRGKTVRGEEQVESQLYENLSVGDTIQVAVSQKNPSFFFINHPDVKLSIGVFGELAFITGFFGIGIILLQTYKKIKGFHRHSEGENDPAYHPDDPKT